MQAYPETASPAPPTAARAVKGFRQPAGQAKETNVYKQADCAAYCATQGTACESYAWIPASGWCGVYSLDTWTAIGDDAVVRRAYRDYVIDEPGCFSCPEGVAVKYLLAQWDYALRGITNYQRSAAHVSSCILSARGLEKARSFKSSEQNMWKPMLNSSVLSEEQPQLYS
ncbi:hypothetical protein ColLi_05835 [Colletotrichum liriopes]|uniref:Uncharacterized protein n=1 Tax=Colletotrichum liriopes TaxID=708192 RepID=A0AA37GM65_9PEZI|nr:hypothetical protein ColLi_05835 [Colletotrichum liriopes]